MLHWHAQLPLDLLCRSCSAFSMPDPQQANGVSRRTRHSNYKRKPYDRPSRTDGRSQPGFSRVLRPLVSGLRNMTQRWMHSTLPWIFQPSSASRTENGRQPLSYPYFVVSICVAVEIDASGPEFLKQPRPDGWPLPVRVKLVASCVGLTLV